MPRIRRDVDPPGVRAVARPKRADPVHRVSEVGRTDPLRERSAQALPHRAFGRTQRTHLRGHLGYDVYGLDRVALEPRARVTAIARSRIRSRGLGRRSRESACTHARGPYDE